MANNAALFVSPGPLVDGSGNPYALGKLFFYQTGSSTPQDTFNSSSLNSANLNPVVADSNGLFGPIYMLANTSYKVVLEDANSATVWTRDPVQGVNINFSPSVGLLRNYIAGLTLSNNTGTPNSKIDVSIGSCADDTNAVAMAIVSGTIDCTTNGLNGLDTGSLANSTWYHVFAIGKTDGTTGLLASTSVSSPSMPSGYVYKRRIGSFLTDGSAHIIPFKQDGDQFMWTAPSREFTTTNAGISAVIATLAKVPTGVRVNAIIGEVLSNNGTASLSYVSDLSLADVAPTSNGIFDLFITGLSGPTSNELSVGKQVNTDTSGRVRYRLGASASDVAIGINTFGWIDRRGKDA